MILHLTSMALVITAFLQNYTFFGIVLTLQSVLSTMHHSHMTNGGYPLCESIAFLDRIVAKVLWIYFMTVSVSKTTFVKWILLLTGMYVSVVYVLKIHRTKYTHGVICTPMKYHLSMHILTIVSAFVVIFT